MTRHLVSILWIAALANCEREVTNFSAYPSPDETSTIAVVEELQGANDHAPWWTHISLRKPQENLKQLPGNIFCLESQGNVSVRWVSSSNVTIFIEGFPNTEDIPTKPLKKEGVAITFSRKSQTGSAD